MEAGGGLVGRGVAGRRLGPALQGSHPNSLVRVHPEQGGGEGRGDVGPGWCMGSSRGVRASVQQESRGAESC